MKRFEQSLFGIVVAGTFSVSFVIACNTPPQSVGGGEGSGLAGATGSPSGEGGNANPGGGAGASPSIVLPDAAVRFEDAEEDTTPASGDVNCGSTQSKLEKKPADLLLVLDRSLSMGRAMDSSDDCPAGSSKCSQRWATIISSLGKVLATSSNDLDWGLKFFSSPASSGTGGRSGTGTGGRGGGGRTPTNDSCYVSSGVEVPVGPGNTSKIQTQITSAGNEGYTPTRLAIDAAVAYLKTVNDGHNKFILLATDGEPNCGSGSSSSSSDLAGARTALENAVAAGFPAYVIGVGPEAANLTSLAQAGGTEKFYSALTPEELSAALATIVSTVTAGCTYDLPSVPVAPDAVGVYVDKGLIPQSDSNGWSYQPGSTTTININGTYCDALTSGLSTLVEIFVPCAASEPIPPVMR